MSHISSGDADAARPSLFSPSPTAVLDHERTGGLDVAFDPAFGSAECIRLDETSWIEHVHGWLAGGDELMRLLMADAQWEQRTRWTYDRRVQEPRLTAEYPVIGEGPASRPAPRRRRPRRPLRRRFLIKPNGGGRSTVLTTHGGDLVLMGGRCQKDYKHSVPKQRTPAGPHLSLNFSTARP